MELPEGSGYFDLFERRVLRPSTEALILNNTTPDGVRVIQAYSPQAIAIDIPTADGLEKLSFMGRLCWDKDWKKDPEKFVSHILKMRHESVVEHLNFTFLVLCDRATSHEIVRHRIASYTQMSQRYIGYADESKPAPICLPEMISSSDGLRPLTDEEEMFFVEGALMSFNHYRVGVNHLGIKPEQARLVLPNECATIIGVTMNTRSLRNFFKLRMAGSAYPQIRAVANDMYDTVMAAGLDVLFADFQDLQLAFDTRGIVENRNDI
jgi:thymidylate synthase (FAD)